MIHRGCPIDSISIRSESGSGVGEWMKRSPPMRITVMRVGKGILSNGMPKRIVGPSTIQISVAIGFSVFSGG